MAFASSETVSNVLLAEHHSTPLSPITTFLMISLYDKRVELYRTPKNFRMVLVCNSTIIHFGRATDTLYLITFSNLIGIRFCLFFGVLPRPSTLLLSVRVVSKLAQSKL